MSSKREIRALTGLRWFAALLVLLFHIDMRWAIPIIQPIDNVIDAGYNGVALFFVLSGFILTYNYLGEEGLRTSVKQFLWTRFARIYPIYVLSLALCIPIFAVEYASRSLQQSFLTFFYTVGMIQAWSPRIAFDFNGAAWSLSVEAFFYVCFPLIAIPIAKANRQQVIFGLLACVGYWIFGFSQTIFFIDTDLLNYTRPSARLPEFVFGMLLYKLWFFERDERILPRISPGLACLTTILFLALTGNVEPLNKLHFAVVPLFGLLIYSMAWEQGVSARFLSSKPLVLLGKWSFAVYLLQVPINDTLDLIDLGSHSHWSIALFIFAITLAISIWAYYRVEEPARKLLRQLKPETLIRRTRIFGSRPLKPRQIPANWRGQIHLGLQQLKPKNRFEDDGTDDKLPHQEF